MRCCNDSKRRREISNGGRSVTLDNDSEIEVQNIEAKNKRVFAKKRGLNSDFSARDELCLERLEGHFARSSGSAYYERVCLHIGCILKDVIRFILREDHVQLFLWVSSRLACDGEQQSILIFLGK